MLEFCNNSKKKLVMHKTERAITEQTERAEVLLEENWMKLVLDLNIPLQSHSDVFTEGRGFKIAGTKGSFLFPKKGSNARI
jgi:hypothetical protein